MTLDRMSEDTVKGHFYFICIFETQRAPHRLQGGLFRNAQSLRAPRLAASEYCRGACLFLG